MWVPPRTTVRLMYAGSICMPPTEPGKDALLHPGPAMGEAQTRKRKPQQSCSRRDADGEILHQQTAGKQAARADGPMEPLDLGELRTKLAALQQENASLKMQLFSAMPSQLAEGLNEVKASKMKMTVSMGAKMKRCDPGTTEELPEVGQPSATSVSAWRWLGLHPSLERGLALQVCVSCWATRF
jgi:hypothetical protein